jgi:hypothetical protein
MALHGKGMLVVYTDVKPRHERDLNEWYNREHIDERIGLPGFHRARRYVAVRGAPRYLATYECDSVSDLATPAYLARLSRQTPWSDRVTARFTRFHRLTLVIKVDLTHGVGGLLTTVRFTPAAGLRTALIQWLRRTLQAAVARPGMVGAAAGENDVDTANAPLREKSMDRPKAEDAEWVVLLEGSDDRAMATARRAFTLAALRKFGVGQAPTVATYRFLFGNQR